MFGMLLESLALQANDIIKRENNWKDMESHKIVVKQYKKKNRELARESERLLTKSEIQENEISRNLRKRVKMEKKIHEGLKKIEEREKENLILRKKISEFVEENYKNEEKIKSLEVEMRESIEKIKNIKSTFQSRINNLKIEESGESEMSQEINQLVNEVKRYIDENLEISREKINIQEILDNKTLENIKAKERLDQYQEMLLAKSFELETFINSRTLELKERSVEIEKHNQEMNRKELALEEIRLTLERMSFKEKEARERDLEEYQRIIIEKQRLEEAYHNKSEETKRVRDELEILNLESLNLQDENERLEIEGAISREKLKKIREKINVIKRGLLKTKPEEERKDVLSESEKAQIFMMELEVLFGEMGLELDDDFIVVTNKISEIAGKMKSNSETVSELREAALKTSELYEMAEEKLRSEKMKSNKISKELIHKTKVLLSEVEKYKSNDQKKKGLLKKLEDEIVERRTMYLKVKEEVEGLKREMLESKNKSTKDLEIENIRKELAEELLRLKKTEEKKERLVVRNEFLERKIDELKTENEELKESIESKETKLLKSVSTLRKQKKISKEKEEEAEKMAQIFEKTVNDFVDSEALEVEYRENQEIAREREMLVAESKADEMEERLTKIREMARTFGKKRKTVEDLEEQLDEVERYIRGSVKRKRRSPNENENSEDKVESFVPKRRIAKSFPKLNRWFYEEEDL